MFCLLRFSSCCVHSETKEVACNKFFQWYPKLLTAVVNDLVLVGVSVDSVGTGWGVEEIGEEVSYRYLCKKRYSR